MCSTIVVHDVGRLADAQAADRVGIEPDVTVPSADAVAQIRERAALDDAELRLTGVMSGTGST